MAIVKPFRCVRPAAELAARVAALPYDVYNSGEAREEVEREPLSFLRIDRAEVNFGPEISSSDPCVYEKAAELLRTAESDGTYLTESVPCFFLY